MGVHSPRVRCAGLATDATLLSRTEGAAHCSYESTSPFVNASAASTRCLHEGKGNQAKLIGAVPSAARDKPRHGSAVASRRKRRYPFTTRTQRAHSKAP